MRLQKCACIETMYGELPFLSRFQAAGDDGFDFVEFWSWTGRDLDGVKAAAEQAGVEIAGFSGDAELSLVDANQRGAYLAFLRRSAAAAEKLGARFLVIHSNGLDPGGAVTDAYPNLSGAEKLRAMSATLKECARIAEDAGVCICLEALNTAVDHPGCFLTTTRMAAELTGLVGSPMLKVLYDAYHMYLSEGDLCGNILTYGSQFGHVHVADAPGRHEPGTGTMDCSGLFACLEKAGYRGLVGYELIPQTTTAAAVRAIMAY